MSLAKTRASSEDHFLATAERYRQLAARLKGTGVVTLDPAMFRRVEHKIAHWERRSKMRQVSKLARFPLIGREFAIGRYQSYSQGWKSMAVDCPLMICKGPWISSKECSHEAADHRGAGRGRGARARRNTQRSQARV